MQEYSGTGQADGPALFRFDIRNLTSGPAMTHLPRKGRIRPVDSTPAWG
jgi:hypothetical protein